MSLKDELKALRDEEAAGYVADLYPDTTEEQRTQRMQYDQFMREQKGYIPRVPEGIPKPSSAIVRPLDQLPPNMLDWGPEEINFYRGLKDATGDPEIQQKLSSATPRWKGIPDVAPIPGPGFVAGVARGLGKALGGTSRWGATVDQFQKIGGADQAIGEFTGEALPMVAGFGAARTGLSLIPGAVRAAKAMDAVGVSSNYVKNVVASGVAGAGWKGAQGLDPSAPPVSMGDVGEEAALWASIDAAFGVAAPMIGKVNKTLWSGLQNAWRNRNRAEIRRLVQEGINAGHIPDDAANTVMRSLDELDRTTLETERRVPIEGPQASSIHTAPPPEGEMVYAPLATADELAALRKQNATMPRASAEDIEPILQGREPVGMAKPQDIGHAPDGTPYLRARMAPEDVAPDGMTPRLRPQGTVEAPTAQTGPRSHWDDTGLPESPTPRLGPPPDAPTPPLRPAIETIEATTGNPARAASVEERAADLLATEAENQQAALNARVADQAHSAGVLGHDDYVRFGQENNATYNGPWDAGNGKKFLTYTDNVYGSTIAVKTPSELPAALEAKRGDFALAKVSKATESGDMAVLSGSKTGFSEEGIARTNALKKELEDAGFEVHPAAGRYGEGEPSVFVHTNGTELERQTINQIGAKYNQESVFHRNKGKAQIEFVTGENKGKVINEIPDSFTNQITGDADHTVVELPGGRQYKFSTNFDWDNVVHRDPIIQRGEEAKANLAKIWDEYIKNYGGSLMSGIPIDGKTAAVAAREMTYIVAGWLRAGQLNTEQIINRIVQEFPQWSAKLQDQLKSIAEEAIKTAAILREKEVEFIARTLKSTSGLKDFLFMREGWASWYADAPEVMARHFDDPVVFNRIAGATSIKNSPHTEAELAIYAYDLVQNGKRLKFGQIPRLSKMQVDLINTMLDNSVAMNSPKVGPYTALKAGENSSRTPIDRHMFKMFGFNYDAMTKVERESAIKYIQSTISEFADALGEQAGRIQAGLWGGHLFENQKQAIRNRRLGRIETYGQTLTDVIYDMQSRGTLPKSVRPVEEIKLTRFQNNKAGTSLDPNVTANRTGIGGAEDARIEGGAIPRLNYYTDDAIPEIGVVNSMPNAYRYEGKVPSGKLYDITKDPLGFVKKAEGDTSVLEKWVYESGHWGIYDSERQMASIFDPVKVKRIGSGGWSVTRGKNGPELTERPGGAKIKVKPDIPAEPVEAPQPTFVDPKTGKVRRAKKGGSGPQLNSMAGGLAGVEPTDDENADLQTPFGNYNINVMKGLAGMAVGVAAVGMSRKKGFRLGGKPPAKGPAPTPTTGVGSTLGRVEGVNLSHWATTDAAKEQAADILQAGAERMSKDLGAPVTFEEVAEAAKNSETYKTVITRQQQLDREARLLATRNQAVLLDETSDGSVASIKEIFQQLRVARSHSSEVARALGSMRINAEAFGSKRLAVLQRLEKLGVTLEQIDKYGTNVDWNDGRQVVEFYRRFIKPSMGEYIDAMRYGNILSSPLTHIVNTASNLMQIGMVRPITYTAAGLVDPFASLFRSDRARQYYVSQAPAFAKGAVASTRKALTGAWDAWLGKTSMARPDFEGVIPTGNKFFHHTWESVGRALEASDVFFRTLAEGGEMEALARKAKLQGKKFNAVAAQQEAADNAAALIFRGELDPRNKTGQGIVSAALDLPASVLQSMSRVEAELTNGKIIRLGAPVKWFVPFVRTPINIAKQGLELTPAGFLNMIGNKKKVEAFSKAMVGSTVMLGAGWLALEGKTTWAAPKGKDLKGDFYGADFQPYSVKVGDKWYSYQRLGPLGYPIALAAAWKHYYEDDPSALSNSDLEKAGQVFSAMGKYFSDQSYVEGIRDMLNAVTGESGGGTQAILNAPSQMIPMSSLLRWVSRLIDPVQRTADKDLSPEALAEAMIKDIPYFSKYAPAMKDPLGNDVMRPHPIANNFSPIQFRSQTPDQEQGYRTRLYVRQLKNAGQKAREKAVEDALRKPQQ